jgi:hypothetical protein
MENNEQLDIQELITGFKDYMGTQAQEIVVLRATIAKLSKELQELKSNSDKVE